MVSPRDRHHFMYMKTLRIVRCRNKQASAGQAEAACSLLEPLDLEDVKVEGPPKREPVCEDNLTSGFRG
jgi:hypothetical protein